MMPPTYQRIGAGCFNIRFLSGVQSIVCFYINSQVPLGMIDGFSKFQGRITA